MKKLLLAAIGMAAMMTIAPVGVSAADLEEVVDHRIEEMKKARSAMSAVKRMVKGNEYDFETAERAGQFIINQTQQLKELFPENSVVGESEAKKTIWENWADFEQKGSVTRQKAEALVAAAQAKNADALGDAYYELLDSCDSCHKSYIKDW